MPFNRRFRNVVRIGPVQVGTALRPPRPGAAHRRLYGPALRLLRRLRLPRRCRTRRPYAPLPGALNRGDPEPVTVSLPLVVVLGLIVFGAVKFLGVRVWVVVVIALFGFYLADTFLAPAIGSGTRSGVQVVNGTHH